MTKWLKNPASSKAHKWRADLGKRLKNLNFYEDEFCERVREAVEMKGHEQREADFRELRSQAQRDLMAIVEWSRQTSDQVRPDFARRVGWRVETR